MSWKEKLPKWKLVDSFRTKNLEVKTHSFVHPSVVERNLDLSLTLLKKENKTVLIKSEKKGLRELRSLINEVKFGKGSTRGLDDYKRRYVLKEYVRKSNPDVVIL